MPHVEKRQTYDVGLDQMWERIGGFGTLHTWHPAIDETRMGGADKRELVLGDGGGSVFETLTDSGETHYSYHIDDSPLPVADYDATIRVQPSDGGCEVVWTADFRSDGASDAEAQETIEGIFQAGLDAL